MAVEMWKTQRVIHISIAICNTSIVNLHERKINELFEKKIFISKKIIFLHESMKKSL